jgi:hypothetical protein
MTPWDLNGPTRPWGRVTQGWVPTLGHGDVYPCWSPSDDKYWQTRPQCGWCRSWWNRTFGLSSEKIPPGTELSEQVLMWLHIPTTITYLQRSSKNSTPLNISPRRRNLAILRALSLRLSVKWDQINLLRITNLSVTLRCFGGGSLNYRCTWHWALTPECHFISNITKSVDNLALHRNSK